MTPSIGISSEGLRDNHTADNLEPTMTEMVLWHASPCTNSDGDFTGQWFVWDSYSDLPPKPIFVGAMEEAYSVSEYKNSQAVLAGTSAGSPQKEPRE